MPPLAILFDLDGTLVQTREASWKIFARTNAAFNLGVDSQQKYFRLLEDNLFLRPAAPLPGRGALAAGGEPFSRAARRRLRA